MDEGKTYEGPIEVTRRGLGFFKLPVDAADPKPYDKTTDLLIPADEVGGAFTGDTVKVQTTGVSEDPKTRTKRTTAKVTEVVTRAHETFVGKLITDEHPGAPHGQVLMMPDSKKMYTSFVVRGESLPIGFKVVLRFKGWTETPIEGGSIQIPWGVVEEIIGPAGVHETEMRALALSEGFHSDFPPGVVAEAKRLEEEGKSMLQRDAEDGVASGRRKDFRGTHTFTIDPFDAKDFDDALSVKFLENDTIEVGVHIADVSFFVRPGDDIDREAQSRATSVYLVDRTIPMLPEVLSNNLCSLNPNEDRLAVSAVFTLNKNAEVLSKWFGETVIHSGRRFTYEDAQEVIDTNEGDMRDELVAIAALARKIRERRVAKGAIAFDTAEVKVRLDENGKPIEVVLKERKETNLLIEDFMLLANESVAEELAAQSKKAGIRNGFIYRVHDTPNADRIVDLAQFLKVMGYDLPTTAGQVKGTDLNALLKKVEGTPEEYLIKTAALRSMAKATYTTTNIGHFGLAFEHYTHFTSPIRRYPDLLVHRMVKHFTGGEKVTREEIDELDRLALHASEREVAAAHAERDSIKMKLVEFMADKVGQEFEAVISGVSDRGLYVELKETHAEGMINIRTLGNDFWVYDEKRYRLVGQRTQKQYALGDPVKVKLVAVRQFERELDFELVS
ncbi:MAG: ribonuclease R [Candidatus Pacebacteria bacterium]|nr:ribonuclease R [Candidatus Paceibacterota bacterium]